jgi:hypothetical protein
MSNAKLRSTIKGWVTRYEQFIARVSPFYSNVRRHFNLPRLTPDSDAALFEKWKKRLEWVKSDRVEPALWQRAHDLGLPAGASRGIDFLINFIQKEEAAIAFRKAKASMTKPRYRRNNAALDRLKQEREAELQKLKTRQPATKALRRFKVHSTASKRSSVKGLSLSYSVDGFGYTDLTVYLRDMMTTYQHVLSQQLQMNGGIKFLLTVRGNMMKVEPSLMQQSVKIVRRTADFYAQPLVLTKTFDINSQLQEAFARLEEKLDEFINNGSGWTLESVEYSHVNTVPYTPMQGSSYIELPKELKDKQVCINVKNTDNECHRWAILSALHPAKSHVDRLSNYKPFRDELNYEGIDFPVSAKHFQKFEKQNDLKTNVYYYEDGEVRPLHVSRERYSRKVDLLLIQKDESSHFVWVKNMSGLLYRQSDSHNGKRFFCSYCLTKFSSEEQCLEHEASGLCTQFEAVTTKLPDTDNATMYFKHYKHMLYTPFFIAADFEAILPKPDEAESRKNTDKTMRTQAHKPCGYGFKVVCTFDPTLSRSYIYDRTEEAAKQFIDSIVETADELVRFVKETNVPMSLTVQEELEFHNATQCHICKGAFTSNDVGAKRHRDHDHFTGKYRGPAHATCNENFSYKNWKVPVIFHNFRGYDSHFIVQALDKRFQSIGCIPLNKEKFMAMSFGPLRFIDSYNFLGTSLDELATNLSKIGMEKFKNLRAEFPNIPEEKLKLLTMKGVYPYEYMDSFERFQETKLPNIEQFYSSIRAAGISAEEYSHAQKVWQEFGIQNLGEYHDLYLKTDVLLLADVWSSFRELCWKRMDWSQLITCRYRSIRWIIY